MRVRVYDEASRTYFHSELYAALYSGIFERYLIMREGRDRKSTRLNSSHMA